ncbi:MAG: O-antigen ligase family protein [Desulfomonile tiedjei]|uniref:O-antigen ligase family protein n=1 Tax=Desulfomonile tiedjei TaxID=2358 RepID=A0A9D6Z1Z3_9BACT|nr:O-antigen ligase family protein [Desulfomonile tiedjei]
MVRNNAIDSDHLYYFTLFLFAISVSIVYVIMFATSAKLIVVAHGLSLLFLGFALSLGDLRSYLIFTLILCIPLQLDFHLLYDPLKNIESTPFMAGIPVDVTDLILMVLYAHWLAVLSMTKRSQGLKVGYPFGAILLIWIVYLLLSSFVTATHFRYSVYECIALFKGFMLYFYLVNNTSTERDLRLMVYALMIMTAAHALYVVWQYATGLNYTVHGEFQHYVGPEGYRSIGFFGSPDATATMMSAIVPMALAYYFVVKEKRGRIFTLAGIFLVLVAMMLTKVRAAAFAVLISSATLLLVGYIRSRISSATFLKAIAAGIIILLLTTPFAIHRFQTGTWGEDRAPLMATAAQMVKDHWILGVGVNNYPFDIIQYVPPQLRATWSYTVHNEYLLRWSETGIMGFLVYYILNIVLGLKLWRLTRSQDPWIFAVSLGLFAWLIGSITHRAFSFYHYINWYVEFCAILALTYLASTLESRRLSSVTSASELRHMKRVP